MGESYLRACGGVIQSACVGGSALSAVIYGFLGELFPLYLVFSAGRALSLPLMIFMCFHPRIRRFIQSEKEPALREEAA